MGINGLWELVKPAGMEKSIAKLAEENGYSYEARQTHMLRIGVDISVMLDECIAATHAAKLYAQFHGGPLRIFFYKLCQLLKCPAIFIFVFDGPERPSMKHGRKINTEKSAWWYEPCMELINSMGFHVHRAPGEAEAELGRLNNKGIIDAVLSNDGDAFVFGARQVLRPVPRSNGIYSIYTTDTIHQVTNYEPSDLLLLALLSGGDYSSGIKACGVSIVTALVNCGFGERLGNCLSTLNDTFKLDRALDQLVEDIKHELYTNSKGFLSSKQPALAARISVDFLDPRVRSLYMEPITSWSPGHCPPDDSSWTAQEPDLFRIIFLCMIHLGWNSKEKLCDNLHNTLLEGLFFRALSSRDLIFRKDDQEIETSTQCMKVIEFKIKCRKNYPGAPWGRLCILASTARDAITTVGGDERDLTMNTTKKFSFMAWCPLFYLPPAIFSMLPHPSAGLKWSKNIGVSDVPDHHKVRSLQTSQQKKQNYSTAFSAKAESSNMGRRRAAFSNEIIDLTLEDDAPATTYGEIIDLTAD